MKSVREMWKSGDRISAFVVALVALLVLVLAGLVLADHSLRQSTEEQATLDATTSAMIVAQEVELAGELLYEMGSRSVRSEHDQWWQQDLDKRQLHAIRAVWVLDTLGDAVIDSAWWVDSVSRGSVARDAIHTLAHHVAASRRLQLRGLGGQRAARRAAGNEGRALLGEPILNNGTFAGIAVALIDERLLLAPAESAVVEGRSFLALLADGDTVAESSKGSTHGHRSAPVRLPLPGGPSWFVVSGQAARQNGSRLAMWAVGSLALALLLFALVRERRQTIRIAERSIELERLSAELLRANRMKSEFLANVSHELRTPLNAIVGFVDLLRDGGYGELSAKQISPVERIATSAARLRTLVDQVLDIAKIAAGRLDVRMETVGVRAFLTNVVSEIEPLLAEKRLSVRIETSADVPKVRTDPTHLRQILVNLLGNAVKYTNEGGIELRAHVNQSGPPARSMTTTGQHAIPQTVDARGWVAIEVADTGIGIASGDLERIFDEFEQVRPHASGSRESQGTGLGLAISRRLAALLGGDVTVESAIGVGSTFTVWLPIRDS
ncbi:MAG TPA: HAMP domain-containing sensor histidine kinase [Gemmatimonadaceae bacterium]